MSERARESSARRVLATLRRLVRRDDLPAGFTGKLDPDEHVLGSAALTGGGHLVVTTLGLWLPDAGRLGWHMVSKASWQNGAIALVEARAVDVAGRPDRSSAVLMIEDLPARRLRFADPGRVPEIVHARVTGSIRSRHHRDLPGGGAWFVQRKVPGRDGVVLQVRPDPGTDAAAARQVAVDVARALGLDR